MEEDFKKMSDENLVSIITVPPSNDSHRKAAIELHKRQRRRGSIQKYILFFAVVGVVIAAITLVFIIFQFFQNT